MKKKDLRRLEELFAGLPKPEKNVGAEISNCTFDATNKADLELAIAAGKLADAIKVLADKKPIAGPILNIQDVYGQAPDEQEVE